MFVDYAKITIKAGDGGNGCLAFRREKYVPRGGPSGGDGGHGGNVLIKSNQHLNTLLSFKFKRHFKAKRGAHGQGSNRHGKNGADLVLEVPVGTQVLEGETRELLHDFTDPDQVCLVAQGGSGGRGNAAFATSTNQAPRKVEKGSAGQERTLILELKTLADVGLIGYPNAGKSTLISVISKARPDIADYPFTTLTPNLGVVALGDFSSFVVADIPGLIQGAHEGHGLGAQFLRHVERTRVLAHLVDVSDLGPENPQQAVETIHRELQLYGHDLLNKPVLIVASKLDASSAGKLERLRSFCRETGYELLEISAVQRKGLRRLVTRLARLMEMKPS